MHDGILQIRLIHFSSCNYLAVGRSIRSNGRGSTVFQDGDGLSIETRFSLV